jgi:hypothetical protein
MKTLIVAAICCLLTLILASFTYAISAQWDLDPISGDWNTAANWTPMAIPNGPADIATFGLSNTTDVSISANTEVNSIIFTPAATNHYTITVNPDITLTLSARGIKNNSGITQTFFLTSNEEEGGQMHFTNSASAGNATIIVGFGTAVNFFNRSTAASASLLWGENQGSVNFFNSSTAGSASISNFSFLHTQINFFDNSTPGSAFVHAGESGNISFSGHSSAGTATIVGGSDGGTIDFSGFSTAGRATVIGNFSIVSFSDFSEGGTAQIELLFHTGFQVGSLLDISFHNAPGVTIGSLAGDEGSFVFLGANNLTIGSNNLSTAFSGELMARGAL